MRAILLSKVPQPSTTHDSPLRLDKEYALAEDHEQLPLTVSNRTLDALDAFFWRVSKVLLECVVGCILCCVGITSLGKYQTIKMAEIFGQKYVHSC